MAGKMKPKAKSSMTSKRHMLKGATVTAKRIAKPKSKAEKPQGYQNVGTTKKGSIALGNKYKKKGTMAASRKRVMSKMKKK